MEKDTTTTLDQVDSKIDARAMTSKSYYVINIGWWLANWVGQDHV